MRVGLLNQGLKSTFCLIRNISSNGVQIQPYGKMAPDPRVTFRVGDEDAIGGRIIWAKDGLAGMEFEQEICSAALLRVAQRTTTSRRRGSPRVAIELPAVVRTGGRLYRASLFDLSMQGARLSSKEPIQFGEAIYLQVGGLACLKCFLRWKTGSDFGVVFDSPLPMQVIASVLS
jgi:hypothetical protein